MEALAPSETPRLFSLSGHPAKIKELMHPLETIRDEFLLCKSLSNVFLSFVTFLVGTQKWAYALFGSFVYVPVPCLEVL